MVLIGKMIVSLCDDVNTDDPLSTKWKYVTCVTWVLIVFKNVVVSHYTPMNAGVYCCKSASNSKYRYGSRRITDESG